MMYLFLFEGTLRKYIMYKLSPVNLSYNRFCFHTHEDLLLWSFVEFSSSSHPLLQNPRPFTSETGNVMSLRHTNHFSDRISSYLHYLNTVHLFSVKYKLGVQKSSLPITRVLQITRGTIHVSWCPYKLYHVLGLRRKTLIIIHKPFYSIHPLRFCSVIQHSQYTHYISGYL